MSRFRKLTTFTLVLLLFVLMASSVSAQTPTGTVAAPTATVAPATATVAPATATTAPATATTAPATATVAAATATRTAAPATATVTLPRTGEPIIFPTTMLALFVGALLLMGSLVLAMARRPK